MARSKLQEGQGMTRSTHGTGVGNPPTPSNPHQIVENISLTGNRVDSLVKLCDSCYDLCSNDPDCIEELEKLTKIKDQCKAFADAKANKMMMAVNWSALFEIAMQLVQALLQKKTNPSEE